MAVAPPRRRLATRTRLRLASALAGLALAAVATSALAVEPLLAVPAGIAAAAALYLALLAMRLADDVEAARGAVLSAAESGLPPIRGDARPLAEVEALREAISGRLVSAASISSDRRLAAVLAALPDGVVVATPDGLVSAANHGGRRALGVDSGLVGTSLFGRLSRAAVAEAAAAATRSGAPVAADLFTVDGNPLPAVVAPLGGEGTVFVFRAGDLPGIEHRAEIEIDLALHDAPPVAPAATAATPLLDAPLLSLDVETTGMDPERDRILSIGAVRLHGCRLFRTRTFDVLVRPGRRIPASATAVHGIGEAMVASAPPIAEVWPSLSALLAGVGVVGHHIDFDLAMLRAAAARERLPWVEPVALDTARLAAALDPAEKDLDLAEVARRHGVVPTGRHTALGDSLATAELYLRLVPRLLDRGVVTIGDAIAFAGTATALVAAQKATPWGRR